jgi:hypothetical protein
LIACASAATPVTLPHAVTAIPIPISYTLAGGGCRRRSADRQRPRCLDGHGPGQRRAPRLWFCQAVAVEWDCNGDSQAKPAWPVKDQPVLGRSCRTSESWRITQSAFEAHGILGEVPPDEMLKRLDREVRAWSGQTARLVVPALHLITVVAQGSPGRDGM